MTRPALAIVVTIGLAACAAQVPTRYVIEKPIGSWSYRRYQRVLDVEFPLEKGNAEGHTATYIRRRKGRIPVSTAFVTVYDKPAGLAAEVRDQLNALVSYDVTVKKRRGHFMWRLEGGEHLWSMWISGPYLVKLGAPRGAGKVPDDIIAAYISKYPSDLDGKGHARKSSPSGGSNSQDDTEATTPGERELPRHLRDNAPR